MVTNITLFSEITIPISPQHNFLSEGVRCGLDKEIAPKTFGAMIERSQMRPYNQKLFEVFVQPAEELAIPDDVVLWLEYLMCLILKRYKA